ncbi:phosphotransferase [Rossellomorea aquimaris]|uniref:phosphotransferase n=1 Tax=Rossellomorea aquimaris TaxID=189382 RepID=UPI0007D04C02|nr:phosphotransferase [Rossellomorea aquimaris]
MKIDAIIQHLTTKGVIPSNIQLIKSLKGGSSSTVYYLECEGGEELVIKQNEPFILREEVKFLLFYKSISYFPNVIYYDSTFQYFVYTFLKGDTKSVGNMKENLLKLVYSVLNHYKESSEKETWGWTDQSVRTWKEFLRERTENAKLTLKGVLPVEDEEYVDQILASIEEEKYAYLSHGDCGVHNFICEKEELTGVIDPTPIYASPLYDFLYAFCSCPKDLTVETLHSVVSEMKFVQKERKKVYKELMVILYIRIGTCLRHHPDDLEQYIQAWSYWKEKERLSEI